MTDLSPGIEYCARLVRAMAAERASEKGGAGRNAVHAMTFVADELERRLARALRAEGKATAAAPAITAPATVAQYRLFDEVAA